MKTRFITSIYIVLAVALAIACKFLPYGIGNYIFDVFILSLTIVAGFEICNLLEKQNKPTNKIMVTIFCVVNYIVILLGLKFVNYSYLLFLQILTLIAYFVLVLIVEGIKTKNQPIKQNGKTALNTVTACMYPCLLFSLYLNINHIDGVSAQHFSTILIILVIAITFLTDTFAYLVGRTFKGPKLAPKISPGKTISGSIGGLLGGIAGAMLVFWLAHAPIFSTILSMYNLAWWHFLIIGLVASVFGQMGDLFESKIKRTSNVKDSGNIFPGHGGMLDRIDAMIFVVSVIYLVSMFIII